MRRGVVVGILGGVVLALATAAKAAPVDSVFLTRSELKSEAKKNGDLKTYLDRNGYPDVAEVRERLDSGQWENQTVILYYLDAHKQVGFGMAHMYIEDFGSQRFNRDMTDEEVAALSVQPSMRTPADDQLAALEAHDLEAMAPAATSTNPADRAEAAAFRAEQAANTVEEAAARTEKAAERAEAVVEKMLATSKR